MRFLNCMVALLVHFTHNDVAKRPALARQAYRGIGFSGQLEQARFAFGLDRQVFRAIDDLDHASPAISRSASEHDVIVKLDEIDRLLELELRRGPLERQSRHSCFNS
ncbi:hypothetical protein [Trinickia acidisoli]|uniref:hypothetical protein n=1 Tax=Trinickia acidisoli TaxID=2767482 RepID=UPI002413EFCD|nr:hypothetical protein [Trinickia acidisoli]